MNYDARTRSVEAAIRHQQQVVWEWMNYSIIRKLFGRKHFKTKAGIVDLLLSDKPPIPFQEIMKELREDPSSREVGRYLLHIRTIRYFMLRHPRYPHCCESNGCEKWPLHVTEYADGIVNDVIERLEIMDKNSNKN